MTSTPLAPHAPLKRYYADEHQHHAFVRGLFDRTAPDYERIERLLALGSGRWYRRRALQRAGLARGARVLDVGIGTGMVAREALRIAGPGVPLIGVDPSPGMMSQINDGTLDLREGVAESLPLDDATVDFVSMGYALRHVSDVARVFGEFHRVLAPGGRVLVLEITRPQGTLATRVLKAYMHGAVPLLARLLGGRSSSELWRYYWDTIEACIAPGAVLQALGDAGFTEVRRHVELGIFSEYTARRPA